MALKTGETYLKGIADDRKIVYEGQPIDSLVHPKFKPTSDAIAQFYDFQNSSNGKPLMTYTSESGEEAGIGYMEPRSKADLRAKAAAFAAWAEITCGFMGRSPDYMNTCMACLGSISRAWKKIDANIANQAWYQYENARRNDACLTHTFVNPFKVHGDLKGNAPRPSLVVKQNTVDGIVVSGARGLATIAPFADANFNLGMPPAIDDGNRPVSASFVIPINHPGVTWVCREGCLSGQAHSDAPLASRIDEMDCVAIFDNCFIPAKSVIACVPASVIPIIHAAAQKMSVALRHHTVIRCIAKLRFLFGLAHLLAESSNVNAFVSTKSKLGEIATMLHTIEGLAIAAVEQSDYDVQLEVYMPHYQSTMAATTWSGVYYKRTIEILTELGAGRFTSTPHAATMEKLSNVAAQYFSGANCDDQGNVMLHKLASDVVGSQFGFRSNLYEQFHFGDHTTALANTYIGVTKDKAIKMVRTMLEQPAKGRLRFHVPIA